VRQLFRRLRTCETGAGLVEYALLIAVVALGLVGVLRLLRNAAGGLTNRAAVGVSTQTGGKYGVAEPVGGAPSGRPAAHRPATPDPDSSSAQPDSLSAGGGATTAFRFGIP
jgi:Flp pilus assembly pilin Flp